MKFHLQSFFVYVTTVYVYTYSQFSGPENTSASLQFFNQCSPSCNDTVKPCQCYLDGWVDCVRKNLTTIPTPLPPCAKNLVVRGNNITRIDLSHFLGLVNLEILEIHYEDIKELSSGIFSDLARLNELNLASNNIERIGECAFVGLTSLEILELSSNLITALNDSVFEGLSSLHTLKLNNNLIKTISKMALHGLISIQSVDIHQNFITTLHTQWFENKPNFTTLLVANNNWNCTCTLKNDYTYVVNQFNLTVYCPIAPFVNSIFNQMCIVCSNPFPFAGRILRDLPISHFIDCPISTAPMQTLLATTMSSATANTTNTNEVTANMTMQDMQLQYCEDKVAQLKAEIMTMTTPSQTNQSYSTQATEGTTSKFTSVSLFSELSATSALPTISAFSALPTTAQASRTLSTYKTENTSLSQMFENVTTAQNTSLPIWAIVVVVIVLILVLVGALTTVFLILRPKKRLQWARTETTTEMQITNYSNKTFNTSVNNS